MNSLYLLIPIALAFTALSVWAFLWSVKNDQFDDLDKAAHSILFDDEDDVESGGADRNDKDDDEQR